MSDQYELVQRPTLDEPLLIVTLEGWVDAGLGAAAALAAILGSVPTEVVASFDVDNYENFVRIQADGESGLGHFECVVIRDAGTT